MYSFSQSPDLRRLSSYNNSATSSPVRIEARRTRPLASSQATTSINSSSIDGFRAYQEHVSNKLTELHAKVNVVLSRSGSPVRPTRVTTTEPTEAPKSSIPYHIGEAYKPSRKVAQEQTRPSSAPRSFSFSQQSGSFSNDAYTDYVLDIKRCEGSRNFYDQEIAKKAAPVKKSSGEISSGGSSPIKSALRSKSINRTWSMPNEQEADKRSSRLNSTMLGGSPVKGGGKTVTWSPSIGGPQKDTTLYDKDKLNQIMARIAVRQAMETRTTLDSAFDKKSFLYAPSYGNSFSSKLQTQAGPYKL